MLRWLFNALRKQSEEEEDLVPQANFPFSEEEDARALNPHERRRGMSDEDFQNLSDEEQWRIFDNEVEAILSDPDIPDEVKETIRGKGTGRKRPEN